VRGPGGAPGGGGVGAGAGGRGRRDRRVAKKTVAGANKKDGPTPEGRCHPGTIQKGAAGSEPRLGWNSASKAMLAIGWYTAERLQREEDERGMRAWSGEKQRPPNEREGRHSQGPNASRPTPLLRPVRHVNVPGPECRGPATGERGVIANGCKGRAGEAPKGPRERNKDAVDSKPKWGTGKAGLSG